MKHRYGIYSYCIVSHVWYNVHNFSKSIPFATAMSEYTRECQAEVGDKLTAASNDHFNQQSHIYHPNIVRHLCAPVLHCHAEPAHDFPIIMLTTLLE